MSDMYLGSQAPIYQNVSIYVRERKTGIVKAERHSKNRVTRLLLWGISKFLSGEFNDSSPDKIYEYIPRYVALGSNTPTTLVSGIQTSVSVNDSRLLNEYFDPTRNIRRINIEGRQHTKTTTKFTDNFVKLSFLAYISSSNYNDLEISEAGLFSKEEGNNCLARVVFSPVRKKEDEIIEIQWDITLLSYGTTKYPERVTIEGPSRVIIPLMYTPYFIQTYETGLRFYKYDGYDWLYLYVPNAEPLPIFSVESNEIKCPEFDTMFTVEGNSLTINEGTVYTESLKLWRDYLDSTQDSLDNVVFSLVRSYTDEDLIRYSSDSSPSSYYFGYSKRVSDFSTILSDVNGNLLSDVHDDLLATADHYEIPEVSKILMKSRIMKRNYTYEEIDTGYRMIYRSDGNYSIVDEEGKDSGYSIIHNEVFKVEFSQTVSQHIFIHNGKFVNDKGQGTQYHYDAEGVIWKREEKEFHDTDTRAFMIPGSPYYEIHEYVSEFSTEDTSYRIDWNNDKEVYKLDGKYIDSQYHITLDNKDGLQYFVTGYTHKLVASLYPLDSTDKSIDWYSLNTSICKINEYGVAQAWSVGETLVVANTTNGIKSHVTVEVVRDGTIVEISSLAINPSTIDLQAADSDSYVIATAVVSPPYATYNVVSWSQDNNGYKIFDFIPLENNKAKVYYKKNGNIGRGYLIATTQDGTSAKALVQVGYEESYRADDCDNDYHNH